MRFQPGEGPSRGLLCDCTTSPINRFAARVQTVCLVSVSVSAVLSKFLHHSSTCPGFSGPNLSAAPPLLLAAGHSAAQSAASQGQWSHSTDDCRGSLTTIPF